MALKTLNFANTHSVFQKLLNRNTETLRSSCVYSPKNKAEYDEIIQKAPHTAMMFRWEKCPHCHELLKDLESECISLGKNSPIAVMNCEIGDEWCKQEWAKAKPAEISEEAYGVPVIVGMNQGGNVQQPAWFIHGQKPDEVKMIFGKLRQAVQQGGAQQMAPPQSAQPQPSQPPQSSYQQKAPMYRWAAQYVAGSGGSMQTVRSGNELCVKGVNCDNATFQNRLKSYILAQY